MSLSDQPQAQTFDPLRLSTRTFAVKMLYIGVGTLLLALASRISVPIGPVPITMQTFAVTMIGALYGWRLCTITVLAWLGEAMLGAPVLANGAGGLAPFAGPTAGYLASFPFVAAMVGYLAERGWTGERIIRSFAAHLIANMFCLIAGGLYLSSLVGLEKAWLLGVMPFILGAALKSALAAAALKAMRAYGQARRD